MFLRFVYPNGEWWTDEATSWKRNHVINSQTKYTISNKTDTTRTPTTGLNSVTITIDTYEPNEADGFISAAQSGKDIQIYKNGILMGTYRVSADIEETDEVNPVRPVKNSMTITATKVVA